VWDRTGLRLGWLDGLGGGKRHRLLAGHLQRQEGAAEKREEKPHEYSNYFNKRGHGLNSNYPHRLFRHSLYIFSMVSHKSPKMYHVGQSLKVE
jgi:hypothetical protein